MRIKKLKVFYIMLTFCIFLSFIFLYAIVNASTVEEWVNYSINDIELYNKTNTYNYSKVESGNKPNQYYNMTSSGKNNEVVTTQSPQITVLTPGLNSGASVWSNSFGKFNYDSESLISRLESLVDCYVYWYRVDRYGNLKIYNISAQNENIKKGKMKNEYEKLGYEVYDEVKNFRITDNSKHIIILFETDLNEGYNDIVYEHFNFAISKAVYDLRYLNNGVLPKINLIGHSRGGITNLQYALDHPDLVASMFSLGTPYLGSTSAMIDYNFLGGLLGGGPGTGEEDIINPDMYLTYLNRWNNNYDRLYSKIDVHALGGYATLLFLQYTLETDYQYLGLNKVMAVAAIGGIELIRDAKLLSKFGITGNVYTWAAKKAASILADSFSMHNGYAAALDILLNEITLDISYPFVSWYNDGLVDLGSQLGNKNGYSYKGFKKDFKRFTISNSNIDKRAMNQFPVVHNLETRDQDLIKYILKEIKMGKKVNSEYEIYYVSENEIGIKTILKKHNSNTLTIPSLINGKTVVEIADSAFSDNFNGNTTITKVVIPSTIRKIGKNAFENCIYLKNIEFQSQSQLREIGDYAFNGCISLENAILPSNNIKFGEYIFLGCESLTQYSYNNNIFFIVDPLNCRTDEYKNEVFLGKGFSAYYKLDLECATYYDFIAKGNQKVKMLLYDEEMNIIFDEPVSIYNGTYNSIIKYLESGTYYVKVYLEDGNVEDKVEVTLDHRPTVVEEIIPNVPKDALEHLHDGHNEFFFMRSTNGFYEIKLIAQSNDNYIYPQGVLSIKTYLNGNYTIINKFSCNGLITNNPGFNISGTNSFIFYVESFKRYYIDINLVDYENLDSLTVLITPLDEFTLNSNDELSFIDGQAIGDDLRIWKVLHTGEYNIQAKYTGIQATDIIFIILKETSNNSFVLIDIDYINNSRYYENNYVFKSGEKIYIGYFNIKNKGDFTLTISRNISNNFILMTDPNENVTVGSEVLLNNGSYGGTTLTQGYTRIVYLGNNAPNLNTRTAYSWYSSDENVAIVSAYGTVTATALWTDNSQYKTVIIKAVYNANPTIVGQIELTVYKDTKTEIKVLKYYGMDVRGDGSYGTEVQYNLGNVINVSYLPGVTIHVGYTRLICLGHDSPSSTIQHFNWTLDRKEGETGNVTVSQYGTVTATRTGTITIKGTYRYNTRFVVYITITVI